MGNRSDAQKESWEEHEGHSCCCYMCFVPSKGVAVTVVTVVTVVGGVRGGGCGGREGRDAVVTTATVLL